MKVNLVRGFFRVWIFVSAIWVVFSWVGFGDIVKNRFPTGSEFLVIIDFYEATPNKPIEIITRTFEFEELTGASLKIARESDRRDWVLKWEFPQENILYIEGFNNSDKNEFGDVILASDLLDNDTLDEIKLPQEFVSHVKNLRQESLFSSLAEFSKFAFIPPLILLVLGGFVFWVFQGFKAKTNKD